MLWAEPHTAEPISNRMTAIRRTYLAGQMRCTCPNSRSCDYDNQTVSACSGVTNLQVCCTHTRALGEQEGGRDESLLREGIEIRRDAWKGGGEDGPVERDQKY